MNSIELIRIGTKILQKNLKFNAELDSELILSNILKTTREKLIIHPKKNVNKLSESKFTFVTDATAPLVFPVNFAPFTTYPKYFSLCAKPIQSTLNNLDVAE